MIGQGEEGRWALGERRGDGRRVRWREIFSFIFSGLQGD